MKKVIISLLAFSMITSTGLLSVSLQANEVYKEKDITITTEYRSKIEKIANSIIKKDGLYQIDMNSLDLTIIDSEILAKSEKILNEINNNEKIMNLSNTLNEKEGEKLANFDSSFNVDPFGFGNWYWWGYAYTFTKADLQWAANISVDIGKFIYSLSSVVPAQFGQAAVNILGTAIIYVGGVLIIINAKFLTLNFLHGGVIGIPSFEIDW